MQKLFEENKRINLSWFYPKICGFQDKITDINNYLNFLDKKSDIDVPLLLYIHIPFCQSLCAYCACFKEPLNKYTYQEREFFTNSLLKEIKMYSEKPYIKDTEIKYIQFGGGTPSCLETEFLVKIITAIKNNLNLADDIKISLEGNVMTLKDYDKLAKLKELGVERISFGVQTFNENIRKEMAIKAKISDIYETVETIKKAGIQSYALDLIYNLPNQDYDTLDSDLEKACWELKPNLIQTYQFNQFYNTSLKKKLDNGYYKINPTPQREIDMYKRILRKMAEHGYTNQILINLFSSTQDKPWTGIELSLGSNRLNGSYMLGLGPGSMSYINGRNYRTYCSIQEYIDRLNHDEFPIEAGHCCNEEELENRVMVFFPNFTKIKINDIPNIEKYKSVIDLLIKEEYLKYEKDTLALTEEGKVWAGNISYMFYSDQELKRVQTSFYQALRNNKNPFNQDYMNVPVGRS